MSTTTKRTQAQLHEEARRYMPGGVGASGRYNPCLGYALSIDRAQGCRLWDVDGKEYIDFNLAHGSAFLGYKHPATQAAVQNALDAGVLSGYETEAHVDLARRITEIIPCAQRVRYGNTGSEGTMVCVRLARAHSKRRKILKFWGHFHGLYDYVMYNAHTPLEPVAPGSLIEPCAESAGMPEAMDDLVVVIPWKDEAALEKALQQHGDEIAGIIMEPINYNQGCIVADKEYMQLVRDRATAHDIVLIYDEVLSAFRTGPDCAQGYYGVTPDLCVLGKAVANGGAMVVMAGKTEIMDLVGPVGPVAQSGTFTGNPLAVAASLAAVEELCQPGFYDHIYAAAEKMCRGLAEQFDRAGIPARVQGLGGRFGFFFGSTEPVNDFGDTLGRDLDLRTRFIRASAEHGVYFHDYGTLVAGHHGVSASHSLADIDEALNRTESAIKDL
ncbi:MAG: aminotransferase class III-fold pyridoxal phosphate-dependent enzyme [Candidatus Latescibacteria bacterium]|nr:aminotransferase class III-fold pyridoxal phosphate-dependent enzyme [Candidatus Latescibacterota bacterium]